MWWPFRRPATPKQYSVRLTARISLRSNARSVLSYEIIDVIPAPLSEKTLMDSYPHRFRKWVKSYSRALSEEEFLKTRNCIIRTADIYSIRFGMDNAEWVSPQE